MDQPNSNKQNKKTVQFAEDFVQYDASYTFDEEELENMFYTNEEVNAILQECKENNDLPLFWRPLRVHRIELLWDEVDREQYHQRKMDEDKAAKRDLIEDLAKVSRRISQPQLRMAVKEATKIAEEVQALRRKERPARMLSTSSHKSLEDSPRLNALQTTTARNSIAARVA